MKRSIRKWVLAATMAFGLPCASIYAQGLGGAVGGAVDGAVGGAARTSGGVAGNVGGAWNALSAYAADGYTLGQGDAAMAVVQAAVDAGKLDGDGLTGREVLGQLRDLLRDAGYVQATPEDEGDAFAAAAGRRKVVRAQHGSVRAELSYQLGEFVTNEWTKGRLRIFNGKRLVVERKIAFGADPGSLGPVGSVPLLPNPS